MGEQDTMEEHMRSHRIRAARLLAESSRLAETAAVLRPEHAWAVQTDARHRNTSLSEAWVAHSPPKVLLRHRQLTAALAWLSDAHEVDADPTTTRSLAELMGYMNRFDEAIRLLQGQVQHGGRLPNRELASLFVRAGRLPDLVRWLNDLAEANPHWRPNALPVVMDTVDLLVQDAEIDEAVRLLESYLMPPRIDIFSADHRQDARLRLAVLLCDSDRRTKAHRLYEDLLGSAKSKAFDHAVAETGVFLAISGEIDSFSARFGVDHEKQQALAIAATGDIAGALDCVRQAVRARNLAADAATGLCGAKLALDAAHQNAYATEFAATLIEMAKGPENAIKYLTQLSLVQPDAGIGKYLHPLIGAYFRAGKVETAARIYNYGIEPDGGPAEVWLPRAHERDLRTGKPIAPEELDILMGDVRTDYATEYAQHD